MWTTAGRHWTVVLIVALCSSCPGVWSRQQLRAWRSTVCSECSCRDQEPFLINCTGLGLESTYSSQDMWPAIAGHVRLIYDNNALSQLQAVPTPAVEQLSLRGNVISRLEDDVLAGLTALQRLDLSQNLLTAGTIGLHAFRGQFQTDQYQPSPLRQLNLSHNRLNTIPEVCFSHLLHLRVLDLSYNRFQSIDHHTLLAITSLQKLYRLSMAGNSLKTLPEGFLRPLTSLQSVDIGYNLLESVPVDLRRRYDIRQLNLNGNTINRLNADSFHGMSSLEELYISYMPLLESIEVNTFSTLTSLRRLQCHTNQRLHSIHPHVFRLPTVSIGAFPLQQLYLANNNLSTLSVQLVPFWDQLLELQLHGNPWQCDCQLAWMVRRLMPHLETLDQQETRLITCAGPPQLVGTPLVRLGATLSYCPRTADPAQHRPVSSGVVVTLGGVTISFSMLTALLLVWKRTHLRPILGQRVHLVSLLTCVVVALIAVVLVVSWLTQPTDGRSTSADAVLLTLLVLFCALVAAAAAVGFCVTQQQTAARRRARQLIRYRRAELADDEDEMAN